MFAGPSENRQSDVADLALASSLVTASVVVVGSGFQRVVRRRRRWTQAQEADEHRDDHQGRAGVALRAPRQAVGRRHRPHRRGARPRARGRPRLVLQSPPEGEEDDRAADGRSPGGWSLGPRQWSPGLGGLGPSGCFLGPVRWSPGPGRWSFVPGGWSVGHGDPPAPARPRAAVLRPGACGGRRERGDVRSSRVNHVDVFRRGRVHVQRRRQRASEQRFYSI